MNLDKHPTAIHHSHHSTLGLSSVLLHRANERESEHTTDPIIHPTRPDRTRYMPLILAVEGDTTILTSARSRFIRPIRAVAVVVVYCRVGDSQRSIQTFELTVEGFIAVVYCKSVAAFVSELVLFALTGWIQSTDLRWYDWFLVCCDGSKKTQDGYQCPYYSCHCV
jgi:hypothetical protein